MALTDGAGLPDALVTAKACLRLERQYEETLRAIELAEELASSNLPHEEAIAQLGQGWVAEEALAIALYCALVARNFNDGVILRSTTTAIPIRPVRSPATSWNDVRHAGHT